MLNIIIMNTLTNIHYYFLQIFFLIFIEQDKLFYLKTPKSKIIQLKVKINNKIYKSKSIELL